MTCDRVQAELSRALDDNRDLAAFGAHLSVCSDCSDFATASWDLAARYRKQVIQGIDRLRRSPPPPVLRRTSSPWLRSLAAALWVLLSVPLPPHEGPPAGSPAAASARVPLFDEVRIDLIDLQLLAWAGEPPLPRRLDQDLPTAFSFDFEPSVALPSRLRF